MSLFEPLARLFSSVCLFLWDLLLSIILWGEDKSLPPITDEILLVSASSLAEKIRNRKIKSVDVVAAYINRIKQVNPVLNAVVHERFSEALKEAEEADQLADTSSPKKLAKEKPLLGIPFTTKDSVAIKGLHQDVGVVARRDVVAAEDADVVTLLRQAGAIPLALTNVPELCMWVESYNNIHGVCNNPYKTHRIAGGSSGGEGSIIGSAGSVLGIGTDLGGSIRIPSFCCGIFGHKPSSDAEIQRKWKSLRTCFAREVSRQKSTGSGDGASSRKRYVYYDLLSFLVPFQESSTESSLGGVEDEPVGGRCSQRSPAETPRRKRKASDPLVTLNETLQESLRVRAVQEDDDDRLFLLSLHSDLKAVPKDVKLQAKSELIQVLSKFTKCNSSPVLDSRPIYTIQHPHPYFPHHMHPLQQQDIINPPSQQHYQPGRPLFPHWPSTSQQAGSESISP